MEDIYLLIDIDLFKYHIKMNKLLFINSLQTSKKRRLTRQESKDSILGNKETTRSEELIDSDSDNVCHQSSRKRIVGDSDDEK